MKRTVVAAACCLLSSNAYAAPSYSRAVQQLYDAGYVSCAPAMDYIVKFFHPDDADYAHFGQWSKANPDSSSASTIISEKDVSGNIVTVVSGGRNAKGTCDISATETINSPTKSCAEIRDTTFKNWKFYGDLNGVTIYEPSGSDEYSGDDAILNPLSGGGCLVIRRNVQFGVPAQRTKPNT